jgi:sensor histidine kinase YesM
MTAVLVLLIITRILDSLSWLPPSSHKTKMVLLNYLFEFISIIPFIFILIVIFRWLAIRKKSYLLWIITIVSAVCIPTLVLLLSSWMATITGFKIKDPFSLDLIEKYTPGVSLIVFFLSATYFLTHLVLQSALQKDTAHKAETLAKDVQLKMLGYQINPHFLFNVLNSIYTLLDENTDKAKKLVIDMSEYYRYTLNKQQLTVSIEKEIESIIKYLEIQKIRFEEEFEYEVSVDETVKSVLIPSFIIQLLVENAVKYGTKTMKQKLIVRLSVILVNKNLLIRVENTGKLLVESPSSENNSNGTSNGIENLQYRLSLYYDDHYTFSVKEENGWVVAAIEIDNFKVSDKC